MLIKWGRGRYQNCLLCLLRAHVWGWCAIREGADIVFISLHCYILRSVIKLSPSMQQL